MDRFTAIDKFWPYDDFNIADKDIDFWQLIARFGPENSYDEILYTYGTLCQSAIQKDSCINEYEVFINTNAWSLRTMTLTAAFIIPFQKNGENYFVGPEFTVWEFFGDIDTQSEAVFLAEISGYRYNEKNKEEGAIREVSDGYEMVVHQFNGCWTEMYQILIHIDRAGEIRELHRRLFEKYEDGCV